jgi:hypothetical protein
MARVTCGETCTYSFQGDPAGAQPTRAAEKLIDFSEHVIAMLCFCYVLAFSYPTNLIGP